MRQHRPNTIEGPGQVDRDDAIPILSTHLADHPPHRGAGAVDKNVDAAQSLGYTFGQSGKGVTIRHVERVCRGMAVPAGNLRSNPFSRRRIAIEDRYARTCRSKGPACGGTNPVAAAGDEGDFSAEIFGHRTFLSNPGPSNPGLSNPSTSRSRVRRDWHRHCCDASS